MWLKYGTPQSFYYYFTKEYLGPGISVLDDIPILMDEYDFYEDIYFDKIKEKNISKAIKIKGIYEYVK